MPKHLKKSIVSVFKTPRKLLLFIVLFFVFIKLSLIIATHQLFFFGLNNNLFDFFGKVKFLSGVLSSYLFNAPAKVVLIILVTSILASLNMVLAVNYVKRRVVRGYEEGLGILGILVAIFGVGCSACGSVLLSSVIGLSASTQLLGILPFKGIEFSLFSFLIMIVSIFTISKKLQDPNVCPIKFK